MISSSLVIVTDRGNIKAYAIEQTPVRQTARPIFERRIAEAHGRYRDKVTDQAGAFATGGGGNYTSTGESDRCGFEEEEDRRIFQRLAQQITSLLREHGTPTWSFAAPAEINAAILAGVDAKLRDRLEHNLGNDLVKTPTAELLPFFNRAA